MMKDKISQVQMLVFFPFSQRESCIVKKWGKKNYRVKFVQGITLHFDFFAAYYALFAL